MHSALMLIYKKAADYITEYKGKKFNYIQKRNYWGSWCTGSFMLMLLLQKETLMDCYEYIIELVEMEKYLMGDQRLQHN